MSKEAPGQDNPLPNEHASGGEDSGVPIGEVEMSKLSPSTHSLKWLKRFNNSVEQGDMVGRRIVTPTTVKYIVGAGLLGAAIVAGYKAGEYLSGKVEERKEKEKVREENESSEPRLVDSDDWHVMYEFPLRQKRETKKVHDWQLSPATGTRLVDYLIEHPHFIEVLEKHGVTIDPKAHEIDVEARIFITAKEKVAIGINRGAKVVKQGGKDAKAILRMIERRRDFRKGKI